MQPAPTFISGTGLGAIWQVSVSGFTPAGDPVTMPAALANAGLQQMPVDLMHVPAGGGAPVLLAQYLTDTVPMIMKDEGLRRSCQMARRR